MVYNTSSWFAASQMWTFHKFFEIEIFAIMIEKIIGRLIDDEDIS